VRLDGARVVVTGASRGIGEQVARIVAARGARVVLVARDAEALATLAAEVGGDALPADLADTTVAAELIGRIEADGPVDVLVNNAGVDLTGDLTVLAADDIVRLFNLNLVAPVLLSRGVIPGMRNRNRGHIVNISSLSGTNAMPGVLPYSASKSGLSHFTAGLRAELKGSAIGTTLVELGPVRGTMIDSLRAHPPTARALARMEWLRLVVDLDMATVSEAIVRAIENDRRHLRMPKRDIAFPMIMETPRRLNEWLLTGIQPGEEAT